MTMRNGKSVEQECKKSLHMYFAKAKMECRKGYRGYVRWFRENMTMNRNFGREETYGGVI